MGEDEAEGREGVLSRRLLLGLGVGAAATTAAACRSSAEPPTPVDPGPDGRISIASYGAVGDGKADATAAFDAAVRAAAGKAPIYVPPGAYRVTRFPDLPDFTTIIGAGADLSTVVYDGEGTLITLRDRHRVAFSRMGFHLTGVKATAVQLANSFRCSFDAVTLRGEHNAETAPRFHGQRGVVMEENTGGTSFINSDINNFGVGITTKCIQNYVTACKFANNRISILGSGADHNAGLSLTNVELVGTGDPRVTETHIRVEGAANDWFLTNCWFEGCDTGLAIGDANGGPAQLGLVNVKIGARKVGIDLRYCRQPYLANVAFDTDTGTTAPPIPVRIDDTGCPQGTAVNLISGAAEDVSLSLFPEGWSVQGRYGVRGSTVLGPMLMRAPTVADSPAAGPVIRSDDGAYWQLVVDARGALSTKPLGSKPPR